MKNYLGIRPIERTLSSIAIIPDRLWIFDLTGELLRQVSWVPLSCLGWVSPPPSPTLPVPSPFGSHALFGIAFHSSWKFSLDFWGPFLEGPENLPGPKSVFGDKCFSTEVNFYYLWMLNFKTFIILWIHWPRTMPVIGEKTFKNILIGAGKLSGISRNGQQWSVSRKSL